MVPQAHIIGQDFSVYYDLFLVVVMLFFCMIACSLWLAKQERSNRFIGFVWAGFLILIVLGSFGISRSIHLQRLMWRDSCARLVASYADIVKRLDHWQIQPGDPEVFSDWSEPFLLKRHSPPALPEKWIADSSLEQSGKLSIPEGLTGGWQKLESNSSTSRRFQRRNQWAVAALNQDSQEYNRCVTQIVVHWEPVLGAKTYRLQWGEFQGENTVWITAYSGAKPFCVLTAPGYMNLAVRVRAENGTPEDNPNFVNIVETLDFSVQADRLVGYAYTLRFVGENQVQYIASPISDGNHNGYIDPEEVPNDLGESFDATPLYKYVREHKVRTMDLNVCEDQWGRWLTIAEPLWMPDKNGVDGQNREIDGILAVDFNFDLVRWEMFLERIYPLCMFVMFTFSYLGAALVISYLQIEARTINRLATGLRETVSELSETKQITDKALQAKTLFLTNMSHEFRTPLNAMLGYTEIIAQRLGKCTSDERSLCAEAVRQMKENGKSLLELVDNVLSVAAMDENQTLRLKIVPVNLRSLITEIADMLRSRAESKSLTLVVEETQGVPEWIGSDPAHLRQILIHLVGNAIKFTQRGGITIHYGATPEQHMLFMSVIDTGIGIDSDHLHSIFKPFSQSDPTLTRQYGGTGIGLSVAQQSAEMLNGGITVVSQVEQGSTFTFTFPEVAIAPSTQGESKGQSAHTPSLLLREKEKNPLEVHTCSQPVPLSAKRGETNQPLTGCRILYVEDTKVNQIVLSKQLEKVGAVVELADNGQIGMDKIAEAEKQGKPFDIILTDMQMPVLDGYEATQQLRASGYSKPIIAVTAHALAGDREKALEAGCNEYITKPVNAKRLVEMLQMLWT
jgi:signal transduction histidine kinase